MNIGFTTYSLPFRWWDNTNIAHNRIFARAIMEFRERGHDCIVFTKNPDFVTKQRFIEPGVWVREYTDRFDHTCQTADLDVLVVFCGPHMPMNKGCLTEHMVRTVAAFKGRVVFVTCDYLLQFNFSIKRYGPLVADLKETALLDDKEWVYVLHGGFDHHFKTKAAQSKMLELVPMDRILEVPLNMSGIPPTGRLNVPVMPSVDLLYCGAYRNNRVGFFTRYFCSPQASKWHISTSQQAKFQTLKGMKAQVRPPYGGNIWRFINTSWSQIICGDKVDSKCASTPLPTRFWEACAARVPVFFDESCRAWASHAFPDTVVPFVDGPVTLAGKITTLKDNASYRKQLIAAQDRLIENFHPWVYWKLEDWLR